MSSIPATHVIQVTNVAPAATLEQMKELFGFLGRIRNIKLYPSENCIIEPQSRVCYVEYYEKWSVGVAQHLTNTVFIDRALIVVPIADDGIPSESTALALTNPSSALPGLVSSGPNALINEISGVDGSLVITTIDPKLTALDLPQYPPLPANLDPVKIEEIRRTVTVGNLDPSVSADNLLKYFNQIGEVKFLRMAGDGIETIKFAFVEFTDQSSVPKALQYNGITFEGRPLIINHSTSAIIKPLPKSSETAQKEIEEAMKRVREAQSLITAVIEPELPERDRSRRRKSRSRSRSHARSSSASRSRHKRSRSRSKRSRSRSKRSRSHSKRSRSRSKTSRSRAKRSRSRRRSRDRHVSRTPSRHSKHKSRSRSRERKKVSPHYKKGRSRSISRERKKISPHYKKGRSRSRSRSRDRKKVSPQYKKGRSRSRSRGRNKKHRRSKSLSPSKSSSKSRSRKSKMSKDESQERERTSRDKEEKSGKESNKDLKSKSDSYKENSQSSELYGPLLPVPKANTCSKEYSKSPVRCNKYQSSKSHSRSPSSHNMYPSSKSHSRSPVSSTREKYKRTRSRSVSKESSSSRRNKSRSASKHRSRSQSPKRSRSRSKGSSRKKQSSPRHYYVRHNSRSITPSSKREAYSPGRYSASRRKSEQHSISSQKRSLSPKRKSVTPKRESKTPVHHLRSPRHKNRSPSLESPRMQNSPSRIYRSPRSPERHSSSLSPEAIMIREKEREYLEEREKLAAMFASSDEVEFIGEHISKTREELMEEVAIQNLGLLYRSNVNEPVQYVPNADDCNSGYNSGDMDLGSD